MDKVFDRAYRALRGFLDNVIGNISALILLAATSLAIVEIFRRYVLGVVYPWGQDVVVFAMITAMFLYFPVAQAHRAHLIMSAVLELLRTRKLDRTIIALRLSVSVFSIAIYGAFAMWSLPTIQRSFTIGRKTESMVFDVWPFQACLALGFALMALVAVFQAYQDLRALMGKDVFPWAPAEETTDL